MFVHKLDHLINETVMVHLDYDDPPESIWIIRRYGRFYRGYQCAELSSASFWIDESERQRSLELPSQCRILSGWVQGSLLSYGKPRESLDGLVEVRYHPREGDHFIRVDSGQRVKLAPYIYFHTDHKAYIPLY